MTLECVFDPATAKDTSNRMRCIIYDRISDDPEGQRENVEIRLDESRLYAEAQDWAVVAEFSDNDISASKYSTKERPQYEEMFRAVAAGACEIVLTTEMERLYRQVEDLLPLIKLAERTPLRRIQCTDGNAYDLSTGPGIHAAIGAVNNAMLESRKISDRTKRKKAAMAKAGRWWGGPRPFGYQAQAYTYLDAKGRPKIAYKLVPEPAEVKLVEEGHDRVLAGESATGIALDWTRRGIKGARGGRLDTSQVRRMLCSPHLAGLRAHHGKLVPGTWEKIVDLERWEKVCAVLQREPLPHEIKRPRAYVLAGILYCHCGHPMRSHRRRGDREYECKQAWGGCGGTRRKAQPIEDYVRDAALTALADPGFRTALEAEVRARQETNGTVRELRARRDQDGERLDMLRDQLADGTIEPDDFAHAKARINERLGGIERALAAMSSPDATLLDQLPEEYDALQQAWVKWNLDQRRAVLRLALNRVTVLPTNKGRRIFDPRRELDPDWRV
jgi:DNA invertase Pin-like site-specific DNA recombinase